MVDHRVEGFIDDALSTPGHTASVSHNHSAGTQALACDDCGTALGSFPPGRWRERHIAQAWQAHLDQAVSTGQQ